MNCSFNKRIKIIFEINIMQMLAIYKSPALIILMFITISGCKKFIHVDPPVTGLVSSEVYSNNTTAAAAITSIYDKMVTGSTLLSGGQSSISYLCGLSADELKNYSTDPIKSSFYANSLNASNFNNFWAELYQYIYQSNAAIEGLTASATINPSLKGQLIGEAKFVRAFLHFYAVNLFGDVPLVTTTDYRINNAIIRTSKAQVYKQIIADLKDAQNRLSDNYLAPTGAVTTERVRPNKGAATALLARIYLSIGDWVNAEMQASIVIANSSSYGLSNLNNVFLKNSAETIWQLQPVFPGINTWDAYYFVLISPPGTGNYFVSLSTNLMNAFEPGDGRVTKWTNSLTSGGQTYYYPYKYKIGTYNTANLVTEYTMVLRLAEQYLIRSEAKVQQGNLSGATSDLNTIRNRAGLPNSTAATQADLLTAILHERQVELFTEWGHRWLDLKRTNTIDAVMNNVSQQKGGMWNTNQQLYPIPALEILKNPNLTQNPGY